MGLGTGGRGERGTRLGARLLPARHATPASGRPGVDHDRRRGRTMDLDRAGVRRTARDRSITAGRAVPTALGTRGRAALGNRGRAALGGCVDVIGKRPIRIANSSGFYGDRETAPAEMVMGGPIDVLTGDYLAELTMLILWKARAKDPGAGYARTVIGQLEHILGTCLDRGIKIVNNAGGLNPAALAADLAALAERIGVHPKIAYVTGDDLLGRLTDLAANGQTLAHLDTGQPLRD